MNTHNKRRGAFFALLFLLFGGVNIFAGVCDGVSISTLFVVENGQCNVYSCPDGVKRGSNVSMSSCTSSSSGGSSSGSCTAGNIEYNYVASGCDTVTKKRTCCNDKTWSGWDSACSGAQNCTSSQCYNTSSGSCESKPTTGCTCSNGTCTRTYSCGSSGWTYSNSACKCKSGYENKNGTCVEVCKSGSRTVETYQKDCVGGGAACADQVCNNCKFIAQTISNSAGCTGSKTTGCYKQLHTSDSWDKNYPMTGGYTKYLNVACYSSTCVVTGNYVCP